MFDSSIGWNKAVTCGTFSGLIWGLISLAVSSATILFQADSGLPHNLLTYLMGGAIYGLVLGGLMLIAEGRPPVSKTVWKAVSLSASLWLLFFITGVFLHFSRPERYHIEFYQHLQGFLLSLVLGLIFGILWDKHGEQKRRPSKERYGV